jgi:hypothetical protein
LPHQLRGVDDWNIVPGGASSHETVASYSSRSGRFTHSSSISLAQFGERADSQAGDRCARRASDTIGEMSKDFEE